jgi:hypothetical protein
MPYDLKNVPQSIAYRKIMKIEQNKTLDQVLQDGLKCKISKEFDNLAKEIGIDISKTSEEVKVDQENFIELQGEATFIRYIQIGLLMSEETTEEQIKAFKASDLYKKCKAIENGLEEFKRKNFSAAIINFNKYLPDNDLELKDGDQARIEHIKNRIQTETENLIKDNTFNSLQLTEDNIKRMTIIALCSPPVVLAALIATNQNTIIETMKKTSVGVKCAKQAAKFGLNILASVVLVLVVFALGLSPLIAITGAIAAGLITQIIRNCVAGPVNSALGKVRNQIGKIGKKQEINQKQAKRADIIGTMILNDSTTKSVLKEYKKLTDESKQRLLRS